jgi:hypothetical protein
MTATFCTFEDSEVHLLNDLHMLRSVVLQIVQLCLKLIVAPDTTLKTFTPVSLKCKFLIADGDSSVHKKLLECRPYSNVTTEKIEFKNHLLRNYCRKLRDFLNSSKGNLVAVGARKCLKANILRLRVAISCAVMNYIEIDVPER